MTKMEMVTTTTTRNNGNNNANVNVGALGAPQPPQDVETAVPMTQARAVVDAIRTRWPMDRDVRMFVAQLGL